MTRPAATPGQSVQTRPQSQTKPVKPVDQARPAQTTRRPSDKVTARPSERNDKGTGVKPSVRPDHKPDKPSHVRPKPKPEVHRVHPRDRHFTTHRKPSYYWSNHHHYYGYRVRVIPSRAVRHYYHGVVYYCYDDIWYRPYGSYYVVCRPPFGTVLAANVISDITWVAVNMAYYSTVAQTYSTINENNEYIAQQNEIIAQNNATIAAQNQTIAMNQQLAQSAYTLANQLGLVQSFAAADGSYYYQDGVFYMMDAKGEYKVIVPPAGALVETLPEDYDVVTLSDGKEYYQVDNTIFQLKIEDGKPYFEVLGQLYS